MTTISVSDFERNFRHFMDQLEKGGEGMIITRDNHPIATILPRPPRMTAFEAFVDIQGNLSDEEGEAWLRDMEGFDRSIEGELRDPWE